MAALSATGISHTTAQEASTESGNGSAKSAPPATLVAGSSATDISHTTGQEASTGSGEYNAESAPPAALEAGSLETGPGHSTGQEASKGSGEGEDDATADEASSENENQVARLLLARWKEEVLAFEESGMDVTPDSMNKEINLKVPLSAREAVAKLNDDPSKTRAWMMEGARLCQQTSKLSLIVVASWGCFAQLLDDVYDDVKETERMMNLATREQIRTLLLNRGHKAVSDYKKLFKLVRSYPRLVKCGESYTKLVKMAPRIEPLLKEDESFWNVGGEQLGLVSFNRDQHLLKYAKYCYKDYYYDI